MFPSRRSSRHAKLHLPSIQSRKSAPSSSYPSAPLQANSTLTTLRMARLLRPALVLPEDFECERRCSGCPCDTASSSDDGFGTGLGNVSRRPDSSEHWFWLLCVRSGCIGIDHDCRGGRPYKPRFPVVPIRIVWTFCGYWFVSLSWVVFDGNWPFWGCNRRLSLGSSLRLRGSWNHRNSLIGWL